MTPSEVIPESEKLPSVSLYFRFYDGAFDPLEVSKRLGIEPTEQFRAGQIRPLVNAPSTRSGWYLKVGPEQTIEIGQLLNELQERFPADPDVVRQIAKDLSIEPVIVCGVSQPEAAPSPNLEFPPSFLLWAAKFEASISVDLIQTAS